VGREEVCGMLAAVEAWVKRDHDGEWKTWLSWLDTISKKVTTLPGVTAAVREPQGLGNRSPTLVISWDPTKLHVTGEELADELARTKPRIAVGAGGGRRGAPDPNTTSITVTAWMMQPGNDGTVASRIHALLSQQRPPRNTTMASPAGDIAGRWDVEIEFFSSRSQQAFVIEQDGNWLQGTHKGEFTTRDMYGTIEGDQVKLRSTEDRLGIGVTFTFAGKVEGDTISGALYMGEYLDAKFTAKRHQYAAPRRPIRVQTGRPLAT
jgi:hypothetical protein